jgi:DNA-binding IclR family transcriptional regulator
LLKAILDDAGATSLANIACRLGLPPATAYRLAASLVRSGFVLPVGRGRYLPGSALSDRAQGLSLRPALIALGRPTVTALSKATRSVAHLGILEGGMVTYLAKVGPRKAAIFTREGKQLEAYCSGIGKVLLAALPSAELDDYLASGPFVALTRNTIIDPMALRKELTRVQKLGFARDDEEVAAGLHCLAVGVVAPDERTIAALSLSNSDSNFGKYGSARALNALFAAAHRLEHALFRV